MNNIINNPYIKTNWKDHIIDANTGEVIQEGTRFTAMRANNIEDGIFDAYNYLILYQNEIQKLKIQLEMIGRVPSNNGTFFDTLEGTDGSLKQMSKLEGKAILQTTVNTGATSLKVDTTTKFNIGEYITLFDEEKSENLKIVTMDENVKTITVNATVNSYKKGSYLMRTNSVLKDGKLAFGNWGTYSVSVKELV